MILTMVFTFFLVVLVYEILALLTKEKYFPTWSSWIRLLVIVYPNSKWGILGIIIVLSVVVAIHLLMGECAFGIC